MKKVLVLLMLSALFVSLAYASLGFKIGIVTGTVSQGEDEYRGAENVIKKYGSDIVHVIYPDNFMQEQETTIARIVELAYDSSVKAIVVCQAVPGTVAAIRKVKEFRPDIVFIAGTPHEDPPIVERTADVSFNTDDERRGITIIDLAYKMGAKTFIHYSFPRHLSMELIARRKDLMEKRCKELGIQFVSISAPDPMGEQGITGSQQFILEDVPRQLAKYGNDTAFFSTNCAMQEPLITAILKHGGIFPEQCCPSPTHGYPGGLGIAIPEDKKGDFNYILKAINEKIVEGGGAGRFATWPVPTNMLFVEAGVEVAIKLVKGEIKSSDMDAIKAIFDEVASQKVKGVGTTFNRFSDKGNFYLVIADSVIFGVTEF